MTKQQKITIIEAENQGFRSFLKEVWEYRSLARTLATRDLKVKYAQTVLGFLWAVLQPLTGLIIFTLFFDKLIKIQSLDMPYPLFVFSGMICWFYFAYIVHSSGNSFIESADLLKKTYFPKLILPISKAIVGFVDFVLSFALLIILMLIMGRSPQWVCLFLPLIVGMIIVSGLSIAIWLSALTVRNRDFHHIIPYLTNFGIWLTPVFYPGTILPAEWMWVHYLNPMAAAIEGFRWSLLGGSMPDIRFLVSFVPIFFLFVTGLSYFRKIEDKIAENI